MEPEIKSLRFPSITTALWSYVTFAANDDVVAKAQNRTMRTTALIVKKKKIFLFCFVFFCSTNSDSLILNKTTFFFLFFSLEATVKWMAIRRAIPWVLRCFVYVLLRRFVKTIKKKIRSPILEGKDDAIVRRIWSKRHVTSFLSFFLFLRVSCYLFLSSVKLFVVL